MVAGALTAALFGDVAAMPRRIGPFTSINQDPKSEVHLWCNRDLPVIVHPGLPLEFPPSPGWRTEQVLLNKHFLTSALQNCSESLPIDRAAVIPRFITAIWHLLHISRAVPVASDIRNGFRDSEM